ncbi:T9SS type A sorting domain-containing protein [Xanthomarina sp.]|uniref:T9SS type A sorting domain-containing protein n=1 Tax=Xanthomarina sp. TaxID=1931211 RepID=UPI002C0C44F0|nr:T9SS type A sorting domain-containing protein [Xanthomarina sp.]HLV39036.1 T9SS type A sorting domain-containing protein [Xanthomarina sp.]
MKNTILKTLFSFAFLLILTSVNAQTTRESQIPTAVRDVLHKLQSVDNLALREPAGLLNDVEKQILKEYYQPSKLSNNTFRATGDVYALDVRNDGIYGSFPLTGPFNINQVALIPNDIYASDFDVTGTLYALETTNANLLSIDPDTGSLTVVAPLTGAAAGVSYSGLSWNPVNSTMYALTTDGATSTLFTLNLSTGVLTTIGNTGTPLAIWIAIDNAGIIYMADISTDNLYTLSPTTGAATLVGPLGVDISFAQEADVDPVTNTLYMAGYIGGGVNNIYTLDVTTGTATAIGTVNSNAAELGMFVIDGPIVIDNNFICDDAITIGLGVINSNGPSNSAGGASNVCLAGATNAEWYAYTATHSGSLTITSDLTSNTGIDTRVSVYNNNCTSLACMASDDNSGANNTSTLVVPVVSGTTYLIEWDDANNANAFDFELSLDISCPDPTNFMVGTVTYDSATFSWNAVTGATNGYVLNVFTSGSDPDVDSPVYTENIPSGTLTATASPLAPQTIYDAYISADCDDDGMSNAIKKSFETEVAPPVCGGTYADAGGASGPYLPNENTVTTITPDVSGDVVTVTFTYVDIESSTGSGNQGGCWDFLTVYNGPNTTSPVLAQTLCSEESGGGTIPSVPGSVLSVGMSFTSTDVSGALTFVFTSDDIVQKTGWLADVTCGPPPTCVTPGAFTNTINTDTTATYTWGPIANASNGYVFSVFNNGDDPGTGTPVYTENVAFGTNTATATGLLSDTIYNAYIIADCDADGMSSASSNTFTTEITPPTCGGVFVDSGGVSGNYSANESTTTTIAPDVSGEAVTVTFTYVDIETSTGNGAQDGCWDYLTIYNGPNTGSPVLAQTLCGEESGDGSAPSVPGSLLSIGMSFTSTDASGALTFVFTSDGSFNQTGWAADVTCGPLSVDEFALSQFNYYPNPTTGLLYINAKQVIDSVKIINLLGQEVLNLKPGTMNATLDFSNLSPGAYVLQATVSGNLKSFKIIKK